MKFVTKELATWNICIFMLGCIIGLILGLNEQSLNLIRHNLPFCEKISPNKLGNAMCFQPNRNIAGPC